MQNNINDLSKNTNCSPNSLVPGKIFVHNENLDEMKRGEMKSTHYLLIFFLIFLIYVVLSLFCFTYLLDNLRCTQNEVLQMKGVISQLQKAHNTGRKSIPIVRDISINDTRFQRKGNTNYTTPIQPVSSFDDSTSGSALNILVKLPSDQNKDVYFHRRKRSPSNIIRRDTRQQNGSRRRLRMSSYIDENNDYNEFAPNQNQVSPEPENKQSYTNGEGIHRGWHSRSSHSVGRNIRFRHYRPVNEDEVEVLDEGQPKADRLKPLAAAHFNGDTSKYIYGQHERYNGNGHLRHETRTFVDWKASDWVDDLGMAEYFLLEEDGRIHVKENGLYLVYAQIYYLDENDSNGFTVYSDNERLLQCVTMTQLEDMTVMRGNTCYTAGVAYIKKGQKIRIKDNSENRYSIFEPGKSFLGLVKIGDV